ncbi:metal ABC transporter permease [Boudabousia liubingyangii]|uniref:Metal ABC transporter permease n=1 Tax=Boudabousia liubingyangii TaxID=1921764 RepID=A0A1Q5PK04_9ACTO|nr:methionine ABC transporter permease [Boudabousia liubingyangii]OKL46549.1 metal ABC transporter permease [Boudabousia liubingyangii]OKL46866.1 metal ABC transporter permease [Boudabousia liubingyangii]
MLSNLLPLVNDPNQGRWLYHPAIVKNFWPAVWETLEMTFVSTALTVLIGLPLGLALVATSKGHLFASKTVNNVLAVIVNIGRSIPFLILAVAVMPLTRLLSGSTIGWKATVIPLTIAAVPYFARLVETNVLGVDQGKIEAAQMMGASRMRILLDVLVREAAGPLVQSITVLTVTIIGYGAMAGALGAGGLGQMAMNYGYNRWETDVMVVTTIAIVIIVQGVQMIGDMLSRRVDHR